MLLPGGYGTMDEAFELLTLVQTGKAPPAPIVLLDVPGASYWQGWKEWVERELGEPGYLSPHDLCFVKVTDDVDVAVDEVLGFFSNYHSLRFVERQTCVAHAPGTFRRRARGHQLRVRRPHRRAARSNASTPRPPESPTTTPSTSSGSSCPFDRRNYALPARVDRPRQRATVTRVMAT